MYIYMLWGSGSAFLGYVTCHPLRQPIRTHVIGTYVISYDVKLALHGSTPTNGGGGCHKT